ncbi:MAG: hypothetical protein M0Z99_11020 [Betaproteobacteria bacterium]|nr:hypothetical protein [Betaproteobacteria bacterium]
MTPAHAAFDEAAAKAMAKRNDCFKCHAPDKTKKGPSLKKIAAKYKEKKLGEKEAIKHMTEGNTTWCNGYCRTDLMQVAGARERAPAAFSGAVVRG